MLQAPPPIDIQENIIALLSEFGSMNERVLCAAYSVVGYGDVTRKQIAAHCLLLEGQLLIFRNNDEWAINEVAFN